jgi:hypothetical protein
MNPVTRELPLEKAQEAFTSRRAIRIRTLDGQLLETGYIMIMYGDVAFRIQPELAYHESQFVRLSEIADIEFID